MARLTVTLDAQTAGRLRMAARSAGVSQGRWVADLIRQRTAIEWPESVRRLAGVWADPPTDGEVRPGAGKVARGLAWAAETKPRESDPGALSRRALKNQNRRRGRRK